MKKQKAAMLISLVLGVLWVISAVFGCVLGASRDSSSTPDELSATMSQTEKKSSPNNAPAETPAVSETTAQTPALSPVFEDDAPQIEKDDLCSYRTRVVMCDNNGRRIWGKVFIPDTEENCPLIITCHGLGTNHEVGEEYAELLAPYGFVVYTFDFCGGSDEDTVNRSDGELRSMSVMTEVSDLEAVLAMCLNWDFIDKDRIYLQGGSQGGLVATIVGLHHEDEIAGLLLCYPDYEVYDHLHEMFRGGKIPDTFELDGMTLGKVFAEDLWDYDVRKSLISFKKPVLILHGSEDDSVTPSSSEKASKLFPDCEYYLIEGADHGFSDQYHEIATRFMLDFLFRKM